MLLHCYVNLRLIKRHEALGQASKERTKQQEEDEHEMDPAEEFLGQALLEELGPDPAAPQTAAVAQAAQADQVDQAAQEDLVGQDSQDSQEIKVRTINQARINRKVGHI